jgi:uracil-DNA glycosylase
MLACHAGGRGFESRPPRHTHQKLQKIFQMSQNSGIFPKDWYFHLKEHMNSSAFKELRNFVLHERTQFNIFPPKEEIFTAFQKTPLEKVKVVILGQDPYHKKGQAHGLAFSVRENIPIPPSLQNIFKELHSDLGLRIPQSGDLSKWAERGVFLLNTALTVRETNPNSHRGKGWEEFTNEVIRVISKEREKIVFILWGSNAQQKSDLIDKNKHMILKAPHPSPLSAYRGFFDSKPFSKTNNYLKENGGYGLNWEL